MSIETRILDYPFALFLEGSSLLVMDLPLHINGLLLDMDGLLLDTERVSLRCWEQAEAVCGWKMPEGFYETMIGNTMRVIRVKLREVMPPEYDVEAFVDVANTAYHDAVDDHPIPVKKGARELLELIDERSIPVCLVTSTRRLLTARKLELVQLAPYLPLRICGDEIEHSKPAPDIYLEGARRLGYPPSTLLALEDSANGLRSALDAGCHVAHVPDICPVPLEVQQRVHCVYRDLTEVCAAIRRGELSINATATPLASP